MTTTLFNTIDRGDVRGGWGIVSIFFFDSGDVEGSLGGVCFVFLRRGCEGSIIAVDSA